MTAPTEKRKGLKDRATREQLAELKRQIKALESPDREAAKIARAKARKQRESRRSEVPTPEQRQPRQRDNAYLAATRREPCLVGLVHGGCDGRIDPAHLRFSDFRRGRINPGKGAKPDDKWCNPLCRKHHDEQHARGNEAAFWAEHGFGDIGAVCEARYTAFRAGADATEVLIFYANLAKTQ